MRLHTQNTLVCCLYVNVLCIWFNILGLVVLYPSLTLIFATIIVGAPEASELGLWGNYSIPKDNPYTQDKELQKEIWALGLRNPWRCSFDSARPSYFACADVGQVYGRIDRHSYSSNISIKRATKHPSFPLRASSTV